MQFICENRIWQVSKKWYPPNTGFYHGSSVRAGSPKAPPMELDSIRWDTIIVSTWGSSTLIILFSEMSKSSKKKKLEINFWRKIKNLMKYLKLISFVQMEFSKIIELFNKHLSKWPRYDLVLTSYLIYSFVASSSPVSSMKQMVFAWFFQDWTLHLSKCQNYC